MYGVAFGLMFLHTLILYNRGILTIPDIIAVTGLMSVLKFPVFVSLFSISLIQLGIAGAHRILELIDQRADIDENLSGHGADVDGAIEFDNVTFKFQGKPVLENISFEVEARANRRHRRTDRFRQIDTDAIGNAHLRCR